MKKIVIIIPTLTTGGGEKIAAENASDLALRGYDVYVLVPRGKIHQIINEKVTLISGKSKSLLHDIFFCIINLKKIQPDIIYSYMERANFINMILSGNTYGKPIISIHTVPSVAYKKRNLINRFFIFITMNLARKSNTIVTCVSHGVKNELQFYYNLKNVHVIDNYLKQKIDYNPIPCLNSKNRNIIFGFLGRLSSVKGCDVLIDSIIEVQKLTLNDNKKYWIIGDGPEKEKLETKINQYELNETVLFLGNHDDTSELLNKIDYLIVPSYVEGFGLVVLEGLNHGCNIIYSECKYGPKEIMSNFKNGFISHSFPDPSINRQRSIKCLAKIISETSEKKPLINLSTQKEQINFRYNSDNSINTLIEIIEGKFK